MEQRLINATHLSERVLMSDHVVDDPTLDAIRNIMNLRFQTLIETEPTAEAAEKELSADNFTSMISHAGEVPQGVYCIKCNTRYVLNLEWIEDGAAAFPRYCPGCGRMVATYPKEDAANERETV